jgi:hypothetical protein
VIFNYFTDKVEIWSIAQKGIQAKLTDWNNDADFGNPTTYDIKVSRKGKDKGSTTYSVDALMKKENMEAMRKDVLDEAKKINLSALIAGDDPFKDDGKMAQEQDEFDPFK